jgi:hypothetical protein
MDWRQSLAYEPNCHLGTPVELKQKIERLANQRNEEPASLPITATRLPSRLLIVFRPQSYDSVNSTTWNEGR